MQTSPQRADLGSPGHVSGQQAQVHGNALTCGVVLLAAAAEHALATDASGGVWSWGSGKNGELGNGQAGLSGTPRIVRGLANKRVTSIAAGGRHCAAASSAGEIFTWGDGRMGQLGHGDTQPRLVPTIVASLHGRHVASVACGLEHSVAVTMGGSAFSFGAARHGRLGSGSGASQASRQPRPQLINSRRGAESFGTADGPSVCKIVGAACGDAHTLLLTDTGRLLACGHGGKGALGLGHPMDASTPQLVPCLDGMSLRQLAAGSDFSLALGLKGEVFAFGNNTQGQLGLGHADGPVLLPQLVTRLSGDGVVAIAAGSAHALALGASGALYSWGRGAALQLGLGEMISSQAAAYGKGAAAAAAAAAAAGMACSVHTPRLVSGILTHPPRDRVKHARASGGCGTSPAASISPASASSSISPAPAHPYCPPYAAPSAACNKPRDYLVGAFEDQRRLALHESKEKLARQLEKLNAQVATLRGQSEQAEAQVASLRREGAKAEARLVDVAVEAVEAGQRRDDAVREKAAAQEEVRAAVEAAEDARKEAVHWQATAEALQATAAEAAVAADRAKREEAEASAAADQASAAAFEASAARRLSHEVATFDLQQALEDAAVSRGSRAGSPRSPKPTNATLLASAEAKEATARAIEARALAAESDGLRLELEKGRITAQLWELVTQAKADGESGQGSGQDAGGAQASTRAQVAQIWPIVVATFERLGSGVEKLRTKLAQETAAREAAESRLRALADGAGLTPHERVALDLA